MLKGPIDLARSVRDYLILPWAAKAESLRDAVSRQSADPGIERSVEAGIAWLCRAQDRSTTADGGAARHYSLIDGWGPSYPETTGYIVTTLLDHARVDGDTAVRERARRMLDWLVSIQFPEGGFQGGQIGDEPVVPVTFNTGQILLGLAAGAAEWEQFREPMIRAADWLVASQDPDGCWRKHPTPFAHPGEKAYETHVAWGLLEAARLDGGRSYAEAALAQVDWALSHQRANGWFDKCCLSDASRPLTHTLGYVLRGVVEAFRFGGDRKYLDASTRTADGLLTAIGDDGYLPGRLTADWGAAADYACLTGIVQIAHCWLLLYRETGNERYRDAAFAANGYVRSKVRIDGPLDTRGGVKGSFPVQGAYGTHEYLNWAAKFFVDANMLEREVRG